ncbi:MAG: glycerate kinase [Acidimicrobiales bacterium]
MTRGSQRRLLAAPDKFRGTATAAELAATIGRAARSAGWDCDEAPVADGGEGILDALGGDRRQTTVRGPLGDPVDAEWRVTAGGGAVVEMARASGLDLVGGAEANDPLRASTYGTGELIAAAIAAGAERVVVGMGGSATIDGGLGAVSALRVGRLVFRGGLGHPGGGHAGGRAHSGVHGPAPVGLPVEVVVACDVTTLFIDAAERFGPQKGATPAQVSLLRRRLERLAQVYRRDFGVDVRLLPGSGAAGGLAGGLAAVGATLVGGFDLVAAELDLDRRLADADLVVTGEGHLDAETFSGKAVGGVAAMATDAGVPVLVVAGDIDAAAVPDDWSGAGIEVVSLVDRFGEDRAMAETVACVETVVAEHLARQDEV